MSLFNRHSPDTKTKSQIRARKLVSVTGCVIALAIVFASCSNANDDTENAVTGGASDADSQTLDERSQIPPPDEPDVRVVEHARGVTEIPVDAENLVALDSQSALNALSLGHVPTGVVLNAHEVTAHMVLDEHDVEILDFDEIDDLRDDFRTMEPDVFIISESMESFLTYELLSDIAPTVVIPQDAMWHEKLVMVGRSLGRQAIAEFRRDKIGERMANSLQLAVDVGKTGMQVGIVSAEGFTAEDLAQSSAAGLVFEALSLLPVLLNADAIASGEVDIGALQLDVVLYTDHHDRGLPDAVADTLAQNDIPTIGVHAPMWVGHDAFSIGWVILDFQALLQDETPINSSDVTQRWGELFPTD